MPKRENLVHEKLKNAKPYDEIHFKVKIPAYLLTDIKTYGDAAKVFRKALKLLHTSRFKESLQEISGDIQTEIDKLETIRENEGELDEEHLQLLELYKDTYFRFKKARILRAKKK